MSNVKNCTFFHARFSPDKKFSPGQKLWMTDLHQLSTVFARVKMVEVHHDSANYLQCLHCIIQVKCGFSGMPFGILLVTIIGLFYVICKMCDNKCL